ncbi:hypothetical protein GCM10010218_17490 [Streptomyces mashuensis]|uniref:Uncharacterized protein n=1 Tax=Streptomyces mashuensis TaxID=33904 RepID=A0A919B0W1_9ACTN|nr:hypothetical protein [Streptomyces mashuensis]GHF36467.1 hypothetical protein GCM10010218_17490 [Streptomyces mashuensis]
MSLITTLARMEAVRDGRARPLATVRHRHLAARPIVLVPLTTAGEAGAPLGALVGTDPGAPRLLVVPQPRDRDLRSAFLAGLADVMLPEIEAYADDVSYEERKETDPATGERTTVEVELCCDAPQLLVPSAAGVEYVRLLGRSMRFRRTAEQDPDAPHPAPPRVPLLGRWLTHYGERARVPGSSLLLSLTQLLARHWATGQSVLEDQHLGALLAWIDPPAGTTGAEAALRAETGRGPDGLLLHPPAGPATDPAFDNALLAPAVARYDAGLPGAEAEIAALLESQLRPVWDAVWQGIGLLRELPEGAHVAERWKRDRWSYTAHRDRLRAGEPPQPRRDDAVTAARKLAARETAQAQLDAQEALDDPLVMAGRRLAGEAFAGEVTAVEMAWSEARVPRPRPLVTVRTDDSPYVDGGARAHRALPDGRSQPGEVVAYAPDGAGGALVTVRLTGGMGRGKEPEPGSVPEPGDRVCWTLFEHAPRGGPDLPDPERTPWTHGGPPAEGPEAPDVVTAEDYL